jgi:hypothetical protein
MWRIAVYSTGSEAKMEISSKTLFVFLGILFLAAAAGANTTPPANCTPHPAIFNNSGPTPVTCPPFNVPGGTLTLVTLSFAADYQFGGTTGTNVVRLTFAPAGPAEVTWSPPSVTLTPSGGRSSGPAPTGMMNASGISTEAFAAGFTVNVTSEVTAGTVASSSGAASVVYTYTPPPPVTLTCPAGSGTVGAPYSSALVAAGGVPPYTFSITSGSPPPGSSLNATGEVKGVPTTLGTFNFTAQVVDSTGTAIGTTTADCAITTTAPVIRYTVGSRPSSPPTGGCATVPNTTYTYATYTYATPGVTVVYQPAVPFGRTVVVNEIPGVVIREYRQNYRPPPQPPYIIAFTDSSIRLAAEYWVTGDMLYYVTRDHELGEAPLNSVDRALSERLNCEKNLPFYLPAELQSTTAQPSRTGWRLARRPADSSISRPARE